MHIFNNHFSIFSIWTDAYERTYLNLMLPKVTKHSMSDSRFRLISNALMNCPMEVYVEGHTLTVIASDGEDIHPAETDVIVVSGGER